MRLLGGAGLLLSLKLIEDLKKNYMFQSKDLSPVLGLHKKVTGYPFAILLLSERSALHFLDVQINLGQTVAVLHQKLSDLLPLGATKRVECWRIVRFRTV